jgi:HK97 family phage portal protein
MTFTEWFQSKILRRDIGKDEIADLPDDDIAMIASMARRCAGIQNIAFGQCVTLIANAIGKCEFKTYMHHEEVKQDEYYTWNMQPNLNQGSSEFIHKWIASLMSRGEALIIETQTPEGSQLLVADDFTVDAYALREAIFKDIAFYGRGNAQTIYLKRPYKQSEVLYFRLPAGNMKRVTDAFMTNYQDLLSYAIDSFLKSRGNHGILKVEGLSNGDEDKRNAVIEAYSEAFSKFFEKESSVMPLDSGTVYDELSQKTYSNEQSRDIRAMIDDVRDLTAQAFGIPPEILNGRVEGTSDAIDNFLTFCIDPICQMIQEEITAKRYGKDGFFAGAYVKIDTTTIKHIDVLSVGDNVDKLLSSGVYSVNEIRRKLGEDRVKEDFADKHFITKNYTPIEEMASTLEPTGEGPDKGGE